MDYLDHLSKDTDQPIVFFNAFLNNFLPRKKKDSGASVLGKMWQEMIIAAIGEAFEEPDVAGISICIRKNEDLISVWNGDNRNDAIRFRIGEKIKQVLLW